MPSALRLYESLKMELDMEGGKKGAVRGAEHGLISRSLEEDLVLAKQFTKGVLRSEWNCEHRSQSLCSLGTGREVGRNAQGLSGSA